MANVKNVKAEEWMTKFYVIEKRHVVILLYSCNMLCYSLWGKETKKKESTYLLEC